MKANAKIMRVAEELIFISTEFGEMRLIRRDKIHAGTTCNREE